MDHQSLPAIGGMETQPALPVQVSVRPPQKGADEFTMPYRRVHQALRGRYIAVMGLGAVLAAALGYTGWRLAKPMYRSESLIRIAYDAPKLNQPTVDMRSVEAFEAFMQSQQALLTSRRLLELALQDPAWAEKGYHPEKMIPEDVADELQVERKSGTEHIKVSSLSADRQKAALVARTVATAYVGLYRKLDTEAEREKTAALAVRRDELTHRMENLNADLQRESAEFGSANVQQFYDAAVARLSKVESALVDVRIAMALATHVRQQGTAGGNAPVVRSSPQAVARFDPRMAKYMAEREDAENRLQDLRLRGYGEEHKQVVQAKKALDTVVGRIQDYALDLQAAGADVPPAPPSPGMIPGLSGETLEQLRSKEQNLTALNAAEKQKMMELGARKTKIDAIRTDIDKLRVELDEVSQRIRVMELEAGLNGRLSILSEGEVPAVPIRDRRVHYAVAGAVGGFVLPAALMAGFGILRGRYRYSDDAAEALAENIPLLGILPQLPERMSDVEMAADAAQCLHQIRVMLQVQAQTTGAVCYLMTSACPGEGKTSLTAALAMSFAAAGARTLVVDADFIGQRLTRGYRLDDKPGLREAMRFGMKESMIYDVGVAGLSVLPAGISDGRDACAVSHKALRRILSGARDEYDIVLIDSGPILGSIEAMVVAGVVDAVVMTISRQQQKPLVDRALQQLRSAGARIAGLVFNKAERRDFQRSVGVSSLRSVSANAESGTLVRAGVTSTSGFGSLVDSVQTYMPAAGQT